jgi:hypothetical protein
MLSGLRGGMADGRARSSPSGCGVSAWMILKPKLIQKDRLVSMPVGARLGTGMLGSTIEGLGRVWSPQARSGGAVNSAA